MRDEWDMNFIPHVPNKIRWHFRIAFSLKVVMISEWLAAQLPDHKQLVHTKYSNSIDYQCHHAYFKTKAKLMEPFTLSAKWGLIYLSSEGNIFVPLVSFVMWLKGYLRTVFLYPMGHASSEPLLSLLALHPVTLILLLFGDWIPLDGICRYRIS